MSSISIFNLNIMHGRNSKSPYFPPSINKQRIQNNLQKIAETIRKHNPDVVTLQEVDQYSVLSGGFNQFDYLKEGLDYAYKYFSPSCSIKIFGKKIFISGNAIFSKYSLENCESFSFDFSFPTERQGFVVADIKLPENKTIAIFSIHLVWLDWMRFSSQLSRTKQFKIIQKFVSKIKNRVIIAGDMNCGFLDQEESLRSFVDQLNLNIFEPENKNLNTHPSWNPKKRIDWIVCSKQINFLSYKIIPNIISDHLAIFANLSI